MRNLSKLAVRVLLHFTPTWDVEVVWVDDKIVVLLSLNCKQQQRYGHASLTADMYMYNYVHTCICIYTHQHILRADNPGADFFE